ncbi:MAG: alpha/beta hydrolase [Clostridiales bacterium]|jgi:acetyl esterase/lipase|nr:alpha/beta hydrolase [Clostridiales bacterium]
MKTETIVLNETRNVTLTSYTQSVEGEFRNIPNRPAILILPGGGYYFCSDREADPVAMPFLKAGYQVFILRYSVDAHAAWPNPLDDYEQAMDTIKSRAGEWHVYTDKIAVIGFSAGGHLAGAAATLSKNRPAAAILGYPAVTGETIHMCLPSAPDIPGAVDMNTCPCFVFATRDDNVVPVKNVLAMIDALDRHGISFETHIYAYGPHGYSTGDMSVLAPDTNICSRADQWVGDSLSWLKDMLGGFGMGRMTEPSCPRRVNKDGDEFLSVDCTVGYLIKQEAAKSIMAPLIKGAIEQRGAGNQEELLSFIANMKLCDAMSSANMPAEMQGAIAAQLSAIKSVNAK